MPCNLALLTCVLCLGTACDKKKSDSPTPELAKGAAAAKALKKGIKKSQEIAAQATKWMQTQ